MKKERNEKRKIRIKAENSIRFEFTFANRCEVDKCEVTRTNDAMSLTQRNDKTEAHRKRKKLVWWDVDIQLSRQISDCNVNWMTSNVDFDDVINDAIKLLM